MDKLKKPALFFGGILVISLLQTHWAVQTVAFEPGGVFPYVWLGAFVFLSFNLSVLSVQSFYALFGVAATFSRIEEAAVQSIPVALLYCIKNEAFGLKERIQYTCEGNRQANLDLWILSDSDEDAARQEEWLVEELQQRYGEERIFYRRRPLPTERKQGNIKEWLNGFGSRYPYFIVCDADSLLPPGWVIEALRIAEHPNQQKVGILQSAVFVTHERSLYARIQAIGQFYAQRFYFAVNQAVLGRSISFGHNQLVRKEAFEKIELPQGILSHDNWETALLEKEGYPTVFAPDLVSFEEAPAHFLEDRKRSRRWLKGTLQGWPLLFLPGISFSTRFLIFYQIYLYLVPLVLFIWILSGLFAAGSLQDQLFRGGEAPGLLVWTLALVFFHKFACARSLGDLARITKEVFFTTLIGLQNVFYGTLDFLALPFEKRGWIPMAKDPAEKLDLAECVTSLFPGTLVGILLLGIGLGLSPTWSLYASPVLVSLIGSIPLVYLSSKIIGDGSENGDGSIFEKKGTVLFSKKNGSISKSAGLR